MPRMPSLTCRIRVRYLMEEYLVLKRLQSSSISDYSYLKTELTYDDTVTSTTMVQLLVRCGQFSKADSA